MARPGLADRGRFAVAAPLLALVARRDLRGALAPRVVAAGAIGFGAVIVLQNAGIERTSVSHAALVVGVAPVLVALIAAGLGPLGLAPADLGRLRAGARRHRARRARGRWRRDARAATCSCSRPVALSAAFIVVQPALLRGRDAAAVTAVQLAAGALFAIPVAALMEGAPPLPPPSAPLAGVRGARPGRDAACRSGCFAFAQARVPAELAGAFVNLEPVVGAAAGWLLLGRAPRSARSPARRRCCSASR